MTKTSEKLNLVWLRRDLRLHDHSPLAAACEMEGDVQPFFIFDTGILGRFTRKDDPRVTFLVQALRQLDAGLRKKGGKLIVLHGRSETLVPKLVKTLGATNVFAARDHEPGSIERDAAVEKALGRIPLTLVQDSFVHFGDEVLKKDGTPYLVFTPYFRAWMAATGKDTLAERKPRDSRRYASSLDSKLAKAGIKPLDLSSEEAMLTALGYEKGDLGEWKVDAGSKRLKRFIEDKLAEYPAKRNLLSEDSSSALSPYIRHGLLSVRECARAAWHRPGGERWLNEIAWRDYYAAVMFHFPEVVTEEYDERYRRKVKWNRSEKDFAAWQEGRTGYPVVDAAMRQLRDTGWMHNRARLITASFLTKHLRIDWRKGEEHFAQYLMCYELSSNNGNWQWSASTGVDPQPYFRVFNPVTQGLKFDPKGDYVRKFVPELRKVKGKAVHQPGQPGYIAPIVEHASARTDAIAMMKSARS